MQSSILFSMLVIFALAALFNGASSLITVKPSNCTSGPTDLDIALGRINYGTDQTIQLMPGKHCVNSFNTTLEGLSNVTLEGISDAIIQCAAGRGLAVFNATDLTIRNLTFDGCGAGNDAINDVIDKLKSITYFFYNISTESVNNITLLCGHCENFRLSGVTIMNTLGLGFLGVNVIGESILEDNVFFNNVPTGCFYLSFNLTGGERIGGGVLLIYADYIESNYSLEDMFKLSVSDSKFLNNSYCSALYTNQYLSDYVNNDIQTYFLNGGGGLSLKLTQFSFRVNFTVTDSVFRNNTARGGAGSSVQIYTGVYNSSIVFSDCDFSNNGLAGEIVEEYTFVTSSAGLEIVSDTFHPRIREAECITSDNVAPSSVLVKNSDFKYNRAFSAAGAGVFSFYSPGQRRQFPHIVEFVSCRFIGNYAFSASALFIQEWKYIAAQPGLNVVLRDVKMSDNVNFKFREVSSQSSKSGVVHVLATNMTMLGNNVIRNNMGSSGVYLEKSIFHIDGSVSFINNSASLGGGVRFEYQSLLILSNNSNLNFISNKVSVYGGAIYSDNVPGADGFRVIDCPIYFGELSLLCFQDISQECSDVTKLNVSILFEDNTAQQGDMVYGTTLDTCPWANVFKDDVDKNIFEVLYMRQEQGLSSPMHFDTAPNNSRVVSTSPAVLVIEQATNQSGSIPVVPGRTINLHASALDQFNRPAYSVITSLIYRNGIIDYRNHTSIGSSNYWLLEGNSNSTTLNVPVRVVGTPNASDFDLILVGVGSYAQDSVRIHITECPPGFVFESGIASCVCDERLLNSNPPIRCNDDDTLSVPLDTWVGFQDNENTTLVISLCHFDYCKRGAKNVSLIDVDAQCSDGFERSGFGCGGCKEGYGLTLGENKCKRCSNFNIFSIIGFAGVGVGLISILVSLRLSISNGYLNGIMFYASVITLFNPVLSAQSYILKNLLTLFSWLNLNIGFELCFYANMTAFQQSVLAFIFPVYLYVLMGLIILVSRCSQKFSQWFNKDGYSATKLFATLFVMTYTSIMSNCIHILGYNTVTILNTNTTTTITQTVWKTDPTQFYFEGYHIPLCLLAIVILAVYVIPAPLILLVPSLVLRVPILKNYKPLYDAFWAPFKPNFRFWIGLRLLLRIFPFIFANFIRNPTSVLTLITFLLTMCFAQSILQPYEGRLRNASDLFLLFDLVLVLVGYLHFYAFDFNSREVSASFQSTLEKWETSYYAFSISIVYILLLIFVIVRIVVRFPILKFYVWKLLTAIIFCKSLAKWLPAEPKIERLSKKGKKSYGSTTKESINGDGAVERSSNQLEYSFSTDNVPDKKKTVATFSELREPLLDSFGTADVEVRHTH